MRNEPDQESEEWEPNHAVVSSPPDPIGQLLVFPTAKGFNNAEEDEPTEPERTEEQGLFVH